MMIKKLFSCVILLCVIVISCIECSNEKGRHIKALADEYTLVYESPNPDSVYCGTPGLAMLPNGRIIATLDLFGPGVENLPGTKGLRKSTGNYFRGKVFVSDDRGRSWQHRHDYPFLHARPFTAGGRLYILGLCDDLMIIRSDDQGDTWSEPAYLTRNQEWTGAADNVHYTNGCVYLAIEKRHDRGVGGWRVADISPVLMRAPENADLTDPANWTFASDLVFEDAVNVADINYVGIPFFESHPKEPLWPAPDRAMSPMGWLETNVVQFTDPDHYWFDPQGNTFHLWMRAHTGGTGYAAMAKVVENEDGSMTTMLETVPSGKTIVLTPFPGGHMKFHIVYDEKSQLFWTVSTQAFDSMTRIDRLPADRYNLPNNERRCMILSYSKNMMDWCFAGLVARGQSDIESRHYASMIIDGDDLHILSRSGNKEAMNPHNVNMITFHTVQNFRDLVW